MLETIKSTLDGLKIARQLDPESLDKMIGIFELMVSRDTIES